MGTKIAFKDSRRGSIEDLSRVYQREATLRSLRGWISTPIHERNRERKQNLRNFWKISKNSLDVRSNWKIQISLKIVSQVNTDTYKYRGFKVTEKSNTEYPK